MDSILNESLLRPLSEAENRLIATVYEPFQAEGRFPVFDYVDSTLHEQGLDATEILSSLPKVGAQGFYGLTWPSSPLIGYGPEATICLTIAGLAQCPLEVMGGAAQDDVHLFLTVLAYLAQRQQQARPNPFMVRAVEVSSEEILRRLETLGTIDVHPWTLPKLYTLLCFEPRGAVSGPSGSPAAWNLSISRELRRYRGVTDVRGYLERLVAHIARPEEPTQPRYPSPLSLPESIDFLNAVWRVQFKDKLLHLSVATAIVQLSLPCAAVEEFWARISALCDVLDRMRVPESPGQKKEDGSLTRLQLFLSNALAGGKNARVAQAIDTLRAIADIRAGQQHGNRRLEISGYDRLALRYPPEGGWDNRWEAIRTAAVQAFNTIREEVQRESQT